MGPPEAANHERTARLVQHGHWRRRLEHNHNHVECAQSHGQRVHDARRSALGHERRGDGNRQAGRHSFFCCIFYLSLIIYFETKKYFNSTKMLAFFLSAKMRNLLKIVR